MADAFLPALLSASQGFSHLNLAHSSHHAAASQFADGVAVQHVRTPISVGASLDRPCNDGRWLLQSRAATRRCACCPLSLFSLLAICSLLLHLPVCRASSLSAALVICICCTLLPDPPTIRSRSTCSTSSAPLWHQVLTCAHEYECVIVGC